MIDAATNPTATNVNVTFHVEHTHSDFCYWTPLAGNPSEGTPYGGTYIATSAAHSQDDHNDTRETYGGATCKICGYGYGAWYNDDTLGNNCAYNAMCNAVGGLCTLHFRYMNGTWYCPGNGSNTEVHCGKPEGMYTTMDSADIGHGDRVIQAVIDY